MLGLAHIHKAHSLQQDLIVTLSIFQQKSENILSATGGPLKDSFGVLCVAEGGSKGLRKKPGEVLLLDRFTQGADSRRTSVRCFL